LQLKLVPASQVHAPELQAPVVPLYDGQLKQLEPQWPPSVLP